MRDCVTLRRGISDFSDRELPFVQREELSVDTVGISRKG